MLLMTTPPAACDRNVVEVLPSFLVEIDQETSEGCRFGSAEAVVLPLLIVDNEA